MVPTYPRSSEEFRRPCSNYNFEPKLKWVTSSRLLSGRLRAPNPPARPNLWYNQCMKNGPYTLVIAPPGYPGKRYRDRYCYEHRLVFWREHGYLPETVHHDNECKRDNASSNLKGMTRPKHTAHHAKVVEPVKVLCAFCGIEFLMPPNKYRSAVKRGQTIHCSRSCSVKDQHRKGLVRLTGRYPSR